MWYDLTAMQACRAILCVFLMVWPAISMSQEAAGTFEVQGWWFAGVEGRPWQLEEEFRPRFANKLGNHLRIETSVLVRSKQGRQHEEEFYKLLQQSDLGPLLDAGGCLEPSCDESLPRLSIHRLFVDLTLPFADIRIGQQNVQWGSANFINPIDPFPELLITDPSRPRSGQLALRAQIPFGDGERELSGVDVIISTNASYERIQGAMKSTVHIGSSDLSGAFFYPGPGQPTRLGIDLKSDAVVGLFAEGTIGLGEDSTPEIALGLDYSFPVLYSLVVGAQFYYNGGAQQDSAFLLPTSSCPGGSVLPICENLDTESLFATGDASKSTRLLPPGSYAMSNVALIVDSSLQLSVNWIAHLGDGSGLLIPNVAYKPTGALALNLAVLSNYALSQTGGILHPDPASLSIAGVDLSGLQPKATVLFWSQLSY